MIVINRLSIYTSFGTKLILFSSVLLRALHTFLTTRIAGFHIYTSEHGLKKSQLLIYLGFHTPKLLGEITFFLPDFTPPQAAFPHPLVSIEDLSASREGRNCHIHFLNKQTNQRCSSITNNQVLR